MIKSYVRNLWTGQLSLSVILPILVLLSLAIRLPIALYVTQQNMPFRADENGYTSRALAVKELIVGYDKLDDEERKTLRGQFFSDGRTGPVHPFLLSIVAQPDNLEDPQAMRFVVVIESVLTTVFMYLLARRIFDHRAALVSALTHAFSTLFISFSVVVWSETTFILFTTVAFYVTTFLSDERPLGRQLLIAAGVGVAWAFAGMSRPTASAAIILTTLWLIFSASSWKERFAVPAVMLAAVAITIWPWQNEITYQTGGHHLLATRFGLNLFRGNTPPDMTEGDVFAMAGEQEVEPDVLFRQFALEEIQRDPAGVIERGFYRMRLNWGIEDFLLRHLYRGVYPPVPAALFALWYVWAFLLHVAIIIAAGMAFGLKLPRFPHFSTLLLLALLANQVFPLLMTGGSTRTTAVNFSLMIPVVGYGLLHLRDFGQMKLKPVVIAGTLFFLALTATTIPVFLTPYYTSNIYLPVLRASSSVSSGELLVVDLVEFNFDLSEIGPLEVTVLEEEYFLDDPGLKTIVLDKVGPRHTHRRYNYDLMIFSYDGQQSPTLEITVANTGESIVMDPTTLSSWNKWGATGLEGVEIRWQPNYRTFLPPDVPGETDME